MVKIGTGSLAAGTENHYLFANLGKFDWAVISLLDIYGAANIDITRISHISEIGKVPEPSTRFLLGAGLIGLWGFRKKFKK
jgi:hypothetical protein